MLPTIFPGDTLLIERASGDCVGRGDIVLFGRDRRLFVHRVLGKSASGGDLEIVTQGDGLREPDPPISSSHLLGKVAFLVRDGRRLEPAKSLGVSSRAVVALVRRSSSAARAIVGIRTMCQCLIFARADQSHRLPVVHH